MRRLLLPLFAAGLGLLACGGERSTSASPDSGSSSSSGSSSGGAPRCTAPAMHTAQSVTCSSNDRADASACTTSSQCGAIEACGKGAPTFCLGGACGCDECLSDGDCAGIDGGAAGGVCSCMGQTRGYGGVSVANLCVPSNCHTDADCGPSGWCSPTVSSTCGSFYGVQGYYCHQPGDECLCDSDCAGDTGPPEGPSPYCAYSSQVGRWICASGFCAG